MSSEIRYILDDGVDVVKKFIEELEVKDGAKVEREIEILEEQGKDLLRTQNADGVTGYNNLFYLRVDYRTNIYRIFFCEYEKMLVLLHGFQKKTQEIPQKEIEIAERRKQSLFKN